MVNGVTLSIIFALYELNSVIYIFLITSGIFAVLGFIGYKTNKDLSSWRTVLTVFLIAGIILSIINIFMKNSTFELFLDWLMLALFFGITIYDMNKVKLLESDPSLDSDKIHIYCAMQLYLDFVNIFLRILSLFGKQKK